MTSLPVEGLPSMKDSRLDPQHRKGEEERRKEETRKEGEGAELIKALHGL